MICSKCKSDHVIVQAVTSFRSKNRRGLLWWIFVGWWWWILWALAFVPMALFRLIFPRKTKITSKTHSEAVCQNCGYHWSV